MSNETEVMIEMGRVLESANSRNFFRNRQSIMKSKKNTVMKNGADFEVEYHLGRFEEADDIKVMVEKNFKSLKLSFYENYPDYKDMLDEKLKAQALENREKNQKFYKRKN